MSKHVLRALPELLEAGLIQTETAQKIEAYYLAKGNQNDNRLFTIFGVFGALLVGLAIILIIAHNWDNFPRVVKTIFAFIPLLIGQAAAGFTLLRKPESPAWREGSSTFLFFAIGAVISLISQIYNIPGSMSAFALTWLLLGLPLVYLLRSSMVSLLYLIGLTMYGCEVGYWSRQTDVPIYYWLLLLLIMPYYIQMIRQGNRGNFMSFHHWFIPLTVVICLGTNTVEDEPWMFLAYFSLFGVLYLIGNRGYFSQQRRINNGYLILGSLGTVFMLLFMTFKWLWEEFSEKRDLILDADALASPEFITLAILLIAGIYLLYQKKEELFSSEINPLEWLFLMFLLLFFIGLYFPIGAMVIANILVLLTGVYYIRKGGQLDHLIILNYGLLIITALIICRFFDTNLSFILRGLLFVGVGVGFFYANYKMLQRRKEKALG